MRALAFQLHKDYSFRETEAWLAPVHLGLIGDPGIAGGGSQAAPPSPGKHPLFLSHQALGLSWDRKEIQGWGRSGPTTAGSHLLPPASQAESLPDAHRWAGTGCRAPVPQDPGGSRLPLSRPTQGKEQGMGRGRTTLKELVCSGVVQGLNASAPIHLTCVLGQQAALRRVYVSSSQ